MKTKKTAELQDFYRIIPKHLLRKQHNPHYDKHFISLPFFGGIFGSSGAGKTQTLMNLIKQMNGTFQKLVICCKSADEPLYKYLRHKIPDPEMLEFYEDGEVPDIAKMEDDGETQTLIVFDDLMTLSAKEQKPIVEFFIRGRKKGFSMVYLSQCYYRTPKVIRTQMNHIFLKRLTTKKDLKMVLSEYGLLGDMDKIITIYKDITAESKVPFLLIRTDENEDKRFSKNFTEFIQIEED